MDSTIDILLYFANYTMIFCIYINRDRHVGVLFFRLMILSWESSSWRLIHGTLCFMMLTMRQGGQQEYIVTFIDVTGILDSQEVNVGI